MLAIICFLPFLALIVTGIIKSNNNHKALPKYDVNYTRQKEMEIWGYYFTPAPEKKALDVGEASNIVPIIVSTPNESRSRRTEREKPPIRTRSINGYNVLVPSEVPDDAFAFMDYDPNMMVDRVHWKWTDKATGKTMGLVSLASKEMIRNVGAVYSKNPCSDRAGHEMAMCGCDEYVVKTWGSEKPILTFRKPIYNE